MVDSVAAERIEFENVVGRVLTVSPPWNPFEDVNTYVGQMKLAETFGLANMARFALWNAYRKDHDSDNPRAILWIRAGYWSNAVVWLNSCEDLACQSLWFSLNLHGQSKQERTWYNTALHSCRYGKLMKRLEESNPVHESLKRYHDNPDVAKLRNWANHLKHRGAFDWHGLDTYRPTGSVPYVDELGVWRGNIKDVHPPQMNLEEALGVAARVHQEVVKLVIALETFITPND